MSLISNPYSHNFQITLRVVTVNVRLGERPCVCMLVFAHMDMVLRYRADPFGLLSLYFDLRHL